MQLNSLGWGLVTGWLIVILIFPLVFDIIETIYQKNIGKFIQIIINYRYFLFFYLLLFYFFKKMKVNLILIKIFVSLIESN